MDQSAYEPLFRSASEVLANYRHVLEARRLIPEELARIVPPHSPEAKPASKLRKPVRPQK